MERRTYKQGEFFPPPFGLVQDSCIVAAHRANERFLYQQAAEEHKAKQEESHGARYVATDEDLPEMFFQEKAEDP